MAKRNLFDASRVARVLAALMMFITTAAHAAPATKTIADVKPPFTFKIRVQTADGKPQPGLEIRCLHPRAERGKPIIDTTAVSDENGVAQFNITKGDLTADRFFWFTFDEDKWCGNSGVGVSPLDNEFEETFIVAPAEKFEIRVTDEKGAPIAKAKIFMFVDHPSFPRMQSGILSSGLGTTTTTEGIGSIYFADVPVNIITSAKGHASSFVRGARLTKDKPYEITLADGQTIAGKVLDDKGKPLGGVSLRAKRTDFIMDYLETFMVTGETGDDGAFELKNAPAGNYVVSAVLKDARLPLSFDTAAVSVGAGEPGPLTIKARPGAVIRGKYYSTQPNLKLADRRIDVFTRDENGASVSQAFKTAADGSFSVTVPPNQSGQILFMGVSGYSRKIVVPKTLAFLRGRDSNIDFDAIPAGMHDGIEVHFKLSGVVQGVVRDADGNPVPEIAVATRYIQNTDAAGAFRAQVDPDTTVTLEVRVPDSNQTLYTSEPFYVSEGQVIARDVQLPRSAGAIIKKAQNKDNAIVGRVVDADGKPVAGAKVSLGNTTILTKNYGTPTWKEDFFGPASLRTDNDGNFTINVLMPGRTDVWAMGAKGNCGFAGGVRTDEVGVEIKLAPKQEKLVIEGTAVGVDGKPEAGARVLAYVCQNKTAYAAQAVSDGEGRFSIEFTPTADRLTHHVKLLAISKSGAVAWRMLPCASIDGLKIQFKQTAELSGRVVNKDGAPVAGARVITYNGADDDYGKVFFLHAMKTEVPASTTGADGRFNISGIPIGGAVSLRVEHPDYKQNYSWSVPVSSDRNNASDIRLEDAMRISGTVRHAETQKPAADTTITLETYTDVKCVAVTNANGEYAMNVTEYVSSPFNLTAAGETWEGTGVFNKEFRPGVNITGLDFTVRKSLAARRAEWRKQPGQNPECKSLVAVIDDADPINHQKDKYQDTLAVYSADGSQEWALDGLNTCENAQAVHTLGWNPRDRSIWGVELVSGNVFKTGFDGKKLWDKQGDPKDKYQARAVALDPKTGNGWVLATGGNPNGEIWIFGPDGVIIKKLPPVDGIDIAYSPHDDCFWVSGSRIKKIDRDGKTVFDYAHPAVYLYGPVAVDEKDGSAWVTESYHPQIRGSKNRLLVFNPDGKLRKEIPLEANPQAIAVDGQRSCAWVATADGVIKIDAGGKVLAHSPIAAKSIDIEPDTGCAWVGAEDGVYRLDPQGRLATFIDLKQKSRKWVRVIAK